MLPKNVTNETNIGKLLSRSVPWSADMPIQSELAKQSWFSRDDHVHLSPGISDNVQVISYCLLSHAYNNISMLIRASVGDKTGLDRRHCYWLIRDSWRWKREGNLMNRLFTTTWHFDKINHSIRVPRLEKFLFCWQHCRQNRRLRSNFEYFYIFLLLKWWEILKIITLHRQFTMSASNWMFRLLLFRISYFPNIIQGQF